MPKFKSRYFILISPLIIIVLLCGLFAFNSIFPFGNKSVAWCDLNQQTIPLLMNFKDILEGNSNLFYSTANAGGMNFWGVFLFFLASPLYLLVVFIEKQDISYFVNILLMVKLALCGFTASLYFNIRFKKLKKSYVVFFGIIYALCNFGLMYYQTLVWLDIMYMFPLLMLSIDRLCIKKKSGMYITILSLCVIINYYLSLMIIIYLIISVPLYIMRCTRENRRTVSFMFIASSLASALITAPVWLCSLIQISVSARSMNNLELFIFSSPVNAFYDKLCVIGGTAFLFAILLPLFKSKLLKKKSLHCNLITLVILLIPVLLDPVNKIWHGGGYQCFPLRFGYIVVFTLLLIAAEVIQSFPENREYSLSYNITSFLIAGFVIITSVYIVFKRKSALLSYLEKLSISADFFKTALTLSIFSFLAYMLFLQFYRKKHITSNIFFMLICLVFSAEFFFSGTVFVGFSSSENKLINQTSVLENSISMKDYYRVKTEKKYTHVNLIGGIGYNSYSHYTSLTPEDYLFAMKKLGYSSYWMEVGSSGGTVMTDALLGNRYSIGVKNDFHSYQTVKAETELFSVAENSYFVPAGIIDNTPPQEAETLQLTDRFGVQQQLAKQYFGNDNLLKKYDFTDIIDGEYKYENNIYSINATEPDTSRCRLIYNIDVKGHQILYFDLFNKLSNNVTEPEYDSVKVVAKGNLIHQSYPCKTDTGFLKLGEFKDESVEIIVTLLKDVSVSSFGVFGVDADLLENELKNLNTVSPFIDGNETIINCRADKNEYLYLAVPWDSGFNAYLNGKKTTLFKVNDSFCALKLLEGENDIRLVFTPEGLEISLILMIMGLFSAILICRFKKVFSLKKAGHISMILCKIAFVSILVLIYIIPVIVYLAGVILRLGA